MIFENIFGSKKKSLFSPEILEYTNALINSIKVNSFITVNDMGKDEEFIKEGYDKLDLLFAVIDRISQMGKMVDIKLCKNVNGEEVEIEDDPLVDLINNPNPHTNKYQLINLLVGYYLTTGDFFMVPNRLFAGSLRMPKGAVKELYVLPPQHMAALFSGEGLRNTELVGWELTTPENPSGSSVSFPKEDVFHIFKPSLSYENAGDNYRGFSPLIPLTNTIKQANSAKVASITYMKNGGPRGVLSQDPSVWKEGFQDGAMSPEQAKLMKQELRKGYQGANKLNDIMVTAAAVRWVEIGSKAVDLDLINTESWNQKNICNVLHMDVRLFNNKEGNALSGSDRSAVLASAYNQAVLPIMKEFVEMLNKYVVPTHGDINKYYKLDTSKIPELQFYLAETAKWVKEAKPAMKVNEFRAAFGLPPMEGDQYNEITFLEFENMLNVNNNDNSGSEILP